MDPFVDLITFCSQDVLTIEDLVPESAPKDQEATPQDDPFSVNSNETDPSPEDPQSTEET